MSKEIMPALNPAQSGTKLQYKNSPEQIEIGIHMNNNRMIALSMSIAEILDYYGGVNSKTLADVVRVVNLMDCGGVV